MIVSSFQLVNFDFLLREANTVLHITLPAMSNMCMSSLGFTVCIQSVNVLQCVY